jgi:hypothetical protein
MSYEPLDPPLLESFENIEDLRTYLQEQFRSIAIELSLMELLEYNAPPEKVFNGMRVIADGTNWNPGGGRGVYWYDEVTAQWILLG